jgi:non-ribosomal peptide synthetase component F
MVGLFLNILPVRIRVNPSQPLLSWLQGIRAFHLVRRAHQYTPLPQVQAWSQILPGTPVFEERTVQSAIHDRLFCQARYRRKPGYPLTLYVFAEPDIITTCVYDPRCFSQEMMQRLEEHLCSLLQQMTNRPQVRVADLSLLTEAERQCVLLTWNATAFAHDLHRPVYQSIEQYAAHAPDALALEAGACQVTYGWLNRRANQLAHLLQSWSLGPHTRVGICLARSPELIIGQLAVLKAGGACVSLDRVSAGAAQLPPAECSGLASADITRSAGEIDAAVPAGPGVRCRDRPHNATGLTGL